MKKQEMTAHAKKVVYWRTHPLDWVKAIFGDNIKKSPLASKLTETGLSVQQESMIVLWGEFLSAKIKRAGNMPLTDEERELSSKIGMSIMSGTGTGKDFCAAIITWHFIFCFHFPKILATAKTGKQLKDVFWSELSKVQSLAVKSNDHQDTLNELQQAFTIQSEIMFANLPANKGRGQRWFCRAVTINAKSTPEEQGEALAGRHEDYQLFVLDEASGIPDAVFKPVEGTLTGIVNVVFMIFNPTRTTGFAVRSHYEESAKWVKVRWNSAESEIVSKSHIENLARYGVDSPTYRCRVLGLPPFADKNTLIPMDWIISAVERYKNNEITPLDSDPLIKGCDIGGGGDKSVVIGRKGGLVDPPRYNNDKDSTKVEDWVASDMIRDAADGGVVDVIGIGHGVFYRLLKRGFNVRAGDARKTPRDPERFFNARAEACWHLRDRFEKGLIAIPDCQDLIDQCGSIKYFPEQKNKVQLKSEIVRENGHSPDEFDALVQTYYFPDEVFVKGYRKKDNSDRMNVFQR
jgi:hypothetical protein